MLIWQVIQRLRQWIAGYAAMTSVSTYVIPAQAGNHCLASLRSAFLSYRVDDNLLFERLEGAKGLNRYAVV